MPGSGIVVLDDYFPRVETGFRIAEFGALLERQTVSRVMTSVADLDEVSVPFARAWPAVAERVVPYDPTGLADFDLAYVLFLNNAMAFLPALRAAGLPMVLTLYPGGGLELGTERTADRLDELWASGLLRQVLTTQPRVTEYLQERFGGAVPVTEVLGVTVGRELFQPGAGRRTEYFGSGKAVLDLCFVAYRYSPDGADKGYPVFLDIVRNLASNGVPLRAHVIGGHEHTDLPVDDLADVITFHGSKSTSELRELALGMDLLVSPNRPNVLGAGAFDGFPTGSAVEAALSGVALVCSDELGQNRLFRDGRSILIERPDAGLMTARILRLIAEPNGIARVAKAGLAVARRHYSEQAQLAPREAALAAALR